MNIIDVLKSNPSHPQLDSLEGWREVRMECSVNNNIQITHCWCGGNKYDPWMLWIPSIPCTYVNRWAQTDIHIVVSTGYKVLIHSSGYLFGNGIMICQQCLNFLSLHTFYKCFKKLDLVSISLLQLLSDSNFKKKSCDICLRVLQAETINKLEWKKISNNSHASHVQGQPSLYSWVIGDFYQDTSSRWQTRTRRLVCFCHPSLCFLRGPWTWCWMRGDMLKLDCADVSFAGFPSEEWHSQTGPVTTGRHARRTWSQTTRK